MTRQEIAELEARINQTIDNFKKDHEVTTSDVNGILISLIVARTVKGMESVIEEQPELVQIGGQSPVPDNQGQGG